MKIPHNGNFAPLIRFLLTFFAVALILKSVIKVSCGGCRADEKGSRVRIPRNPVAVLEECGFQHVTGVPCAGKTKTVCRSLSQNTCLFERRTV